MLPCFFHFKGMGYLFFCLLFAFYALSLFAEEPETMETLFAKKKDAIFLVNQSILLDSNKLTHKSFFEKLEVALNRKVVNQYIPIASGSAFLINKDGYLITNAHVIKYLSVESKIKWAQWSFLEYLSKYMIPGILSEKELDTVVREYYHMVKNAPIIISVKATNKKEYDAKIIAQQSNLDLALLKINLEDKIEPLAIEDNINFKEGDAVYTIGYPLPFLMDKFLDDFKPTLTNGIISAIRNDVWDIQHTASINPGNSGGPLLTKYGKLIGVNVGLITDANSLYFSIVSKKIIQWLREIERAEIINYQPN